MQINKQVSFKVKLYNRTILYENTQQSGRNSPSSKSKLKISYEETDEMKHEYSQKKQNHTSNSYFIAKSRKKFEIEKNNMIEYLMKLKANILI